MTDTAIPDDIEHMSRAVAAKLLDRGIGDEDVFSQVIARAILAERERCARICDEQSAIFASDSYATGQPISSLSERFACANVKAAILKGEA